MASYRAAIDRGAEMIEADAQLSRDGRLVMMHDPSLDRTTNGSGRAGDYTWDELSRLDAGSWFDPRFGGLRIPLAEEIMDLAAETGIALCLEAKGESMEEARDVAVALARLIRDRGAEEWAFVSSFHHPAVQAAKAEVQRLQIAPERLPEHGPVAADEVLRQALSLGTPVIQHRWELLTAELIDLLHEHGIAVWAWNTNDERSVAAALGLGADGLMGDDVTLIRAGRDAARPSGPPLPV